MPNHLHGIFVISDFMSRKGAPSETRADARPAPTIADRIEAVLDKCTIVEAERTRTVYNWLQYFSPENLEKEFRATGFSVKGLYSDVAGTPYDRKSNEFAVIAGKA